MPRTSERPWRQYLTPAERKAVDECDEARRKWQELQPRRSVLQIRAFSRMRYAEQKEQRA